MALISHYHANDTMSSLICDNTHIITILSRFNIPLGFENNSIENVCSNNNIDTNTFLAVVNTLLSGDKSDHINYENISVNNLMDYLKSSHKYQIEYRLPNILSNLKNNLNNSVDNNITKVVIKYFIDYIEEVKKHLNYEETVVFEYIHKLTNNINTDEYCIDIFVDKHDNIEEKLEELKNIVIKYFNTPSTNELISILEDIFKCSEELQQHNNIENYLLIPIVKYIENTSI